MPTNKRERRGLREAVAALAITAACASALASTADAQRATQFKSSDRVVPVHNKVTLRGSLPLPVLAESEIATDPEGETSPAQAKKRPKRVRAHVQFRAVGAKHWQKVRGFKTGKGGRFKQRIQPRRSGRYRVQSAHGATTRPVKVTVRTKIRGKVDRNAKVGDKAKVRGRVFPISKGRPVKIRAAGKTVRTKTRRDGRFSARFRVGSAGTTKVKLRAKGNRIAAASGSKAGRITVFRPAYASYYGPGLYGGPLACGGRLGTGTIGVAHKTLPCGTKLTLKLGSRTVKARVIDRGPFVGGREFDLTAATKQRLGFGDLGTIWVDR